MINWVAENSDKGTSGDINNALKPIIGVHACFAFMDILLAVTDFFSVLELVFDDFFSLKDGLNKIIWRAFCIGASKLIQEYVRLLMAST